MPKPMPKCRMYVNQGSPLFNQVVRNVPVLAPRHQALLGGDVREASLACMTGIIHNDDQSEQDQQTRALESAAAEGVSSGLNQPETETSLAKENKALVAAVVKRRKLYRQLSGTEVPCFLMITPWTC